jgi:hypothetical protein
MQVKFFVIVVEIDLEDCGTLIRDETAHSITTIEDTKTGPLSLTVTTDRVQTVLNKYHIHINIHLDSKKH